MNIDISILKREIARLKKLEESYENIYLTYYNIIDGVANEWNNVYEKRLMENVATEKKQMNMVYNDLKEVSALYSFICEKYSFANKIIVSINKEDAIMKKLNNCVSHLKKIVKLLGNINTNEIDNYKIGIINDIGYRIAKELEKFEELRNNIHDMVEKINDIESDIKAKVSELSLDIITETDISDCIEQ